MTVQTSSDWWRKPRDQGMIDVDKAVWQPFLQLYLDLVNKIEENLSLRYKVQKNSGINFSSDIVFL